MANEKIKTSELFASVHKAATLSGWLIAEASPGHPRFRSAELGRRTLEDL